MLAWRTAFFSTVILSAILAFTFSSSTVLARRASQNLARNAVAQAVEFQSVDFVSDDNLCGIAANGRTKCFDWNMTEVTVADSIVGVQKTEDVIASAIGVCAYDVDGIKCISEDRSKVKLRELIEDSVRGSVMASGSNACGVNAKNGTLRCLVPEWSSFSRHSFRIQPKLKIGAIGISSYTICWADGDVINCQSDGSTKSYAFAGATTIITSPTVCARNETTAQCWPTATAPITLAPEFVTAKKWITDGYTTFAALTADNRFITMNLSSGVVNPAGTQNPPAGFEQPGGLTDLWAGDYMHFCGINGVAATATCWMGYTTAQTEVKFKEPVLGFVKGSAAPCALLQSGQIQCASENGTTEQSLWAGGAMHARLHLENKCVWNASGASCLANDGFNPGPGIEKLETDLEQGHACAVQKSTTSSTTEVVCTPTLKQVPQSTMGATWLAVADGKACAVSPTGLFCWGDEYDGEKIPSSFLDAKKVLMTDTYACALDSFGLVCWGDLATHSLQVPSDLTTAGAVSDFALGESRVCAIGVGGSVQCWGEKQADDEDPPALAGVTAIYGSRQHVFCAQNATGLHCWGGDTAFPR